MKAQAQTPQQQIHIVERTPKPQPATVDETDEGRVATVDGKRYTEAKHPLFFKALDALTAHPEYMEKVGKNYKYSVREVAAKAGVSKSYVAFARKCLEDGSMSA